MAASLDIAIEKFFDDKTRMEEKCQAQWPVQIVRFTMMMVSEIVSPQVKILVR